MNKDFREFSFQAADKARVDRENGLIRDVVILKSDSKNRRRYTEVAKREFAEQLLANPRAYENHARITEDGHREAPGVFDILGRWSGIRIEGGSVIGDLRPLGHKKEQLFDLAEHAPDLFGISIFASGESNFNAKENIEEITSITYAYSADVVSEPAATTNLFESINNRGSNMDFKEKYEEAIVEKECLQEKLDELKPKIAKLTELEAQLVTLETEAAQGKHRAEITEKLKAADIDVSHLQFCESFDEKTLDAYIEAQKTVKGVAPSADTKPTLPGDKKTEKFPPLAEQDWSIN